MESCPNLQLQPLEKNHGSMVLRNHALRNGPSPLLNRNSSIRSCVLSFKDTICAVRNNSNEIHSSEIKIGREVGIGAFGSIFKGTWNGKKCACKMLEKGRPHPQAHRPRPVQTDPSRRRRRLPQRGLGTGAARVHQLGRGGGQIIFAVDFPCARARGDSLTNKELTGPEQPCK